MRRFVIAVVVLTAFCLLTFSQSAQSTSSPIEVSYTRFGIQWSVFLPSVGCILTVSGPDGFYWKQEYGANSRPEFGPVNDQGLPRPEGLYRWELVAQVPPGNGAEAPGEPNPVMSGSFELRGGRIIPRPDDAQPAVVEDGAPDHSLFLDRAGRLGMGTSVPGSMLHLKGSNPAATLEDTTTGGGAFTLQSLRKGDGSFGLFDKTGQARWLVDSGGRIGIGTTKPTSALTVDGYIESTKGFLVNGRPVGGTGLFGTTQPLATEGSSNTLFGYHAGFSDSSISSNSDNSFFGAYAGEHSAYPGTQNSFFGAETGRSNTSGSNNSFFGWIAGWDNTTGYRNSFFGTASGRMNTTGKENSFFGSGSASNNTIGSDNCFFGYETGRFNSEGSRNSFFGYTVGFNNGTGNKNSFFGDSAGYHNTSSYNSFFGVESGYANTTGSFNAFFGSYSGRANTTGYENSFFGDYAGWLNTTGTLNCFFGHNAGLINSTGTSNSFFGMQAGDWNTVENYNTFIGYNADLDPGPNPSTNPVTNATAIGANAYVGQSNSLVLGSIAGVNGATSYVNVGIGTTTPARQLHLAGPNAVFRMDRTSDTASFILVRTDATGTIPWKTFVVGTNATGVNRGEFVINDIGAAVGGGGNRRMTITNDGNVEFTGTVTALDFASPSSIALKSNVRTLENAIETVNRLRGVRFDWKDSGKPAVGLIAEEVNEVLPEVVALEGGKAKGVNYANLVALLVQAVKEQQKTIEEQEARLAKLERLLAER